MKPTQIACVALTLLSGNNAYAAAATSNTTLTQALLSDGYLDLGIYADAYEKAVAFVDTLNVTQKVDIITGTDIDSFPTLIKKDGVGGLVYHYYVSGFVLPNALAMTWDRNHVNKMYKALGDEFFGMGYNIVNAPQPGPMGRTPWSGRLMAAFTPDPYLNGMALAQSVEGLRDAKMIAHGKHFLLNEQETNRSSMSGGSAYSANADDKTTHEIYSWAFADGIKSGMGAVMCAMNRVNDTLSCENNALLSKMLKEQLGFPGHVRPDVGAQTTSYGSANAGLDFGSSTYWTTDILNAGIANGSFTEARLDDMVVRNVLPYYFIGQDQLDPQVEAGFTEYRDVRANHASIIRNIAADSLVLLKNNNADGRGLPLKKPLTTALFGVHAGPAMGGPNKVFTTNGVSGSVYQGHLATGAGSEQGSLGYVSTPYAAIQDRVTSWGGMLWWIMNDTYADASSSSGSSSFGGGGFGGGFSGNASIPGDSGMNGGVGGIMKRAASVTGGGSGTSGSLTFDSYATNADACLVFMNAYSGEGADRTELYNADQDTLVNTVAAECNNTVVVINTVGPRLVDQWIENENVTAVLYGGLLGEQSGNSITDVLFGDVNPSGKLTYTLAKNETDYPVDICEDSECDFTEKGLIDYRWFDAKVRHLSALEF